MVGLSSRALILLLAYSFTSGTSISKPLAGEVQKQGGVGVTRIGRPAGPQLFGTAQQAGLNAKVQTNDFDLNAQHATAAPTTPPTGPLPMETGIRSITIKPLIEDAPKIPATSHGSGEGAEATSPPITMPPTKQVIIVRLIYHMLDEQNMYKACKMCLALRQTGCDVVLMLDKEATRVANKNLHSQFIDRKETRARAPHDALESVLNNGVRVVASKDWANDFGVDESNSVSGVELLSTDQLAAEIVRSTKILEY